MLLSVLDGQGFAQTVIAQSQADATDRSGSITTTATSQALMVANANRSGWFVQNISDEILTIGDLGTDATLAGAITIYPGNTFPPPGYPVTVTAINIAGTAGKLFVAREW